MKKDLVIFKVPKKDMPARGLLTGRRWRLGEVPKDKKQAPQMMN